MIKTVLTIVQLIISIIMIVVVLMQSGKEAGLGAISGNTDTYMGKNKGNSMEQKIAASTKWVALVWIVLTLALNIV